MASFGLSPSSLKSLHSKKSNFPANPLYFPGNSALFSISSCIRLITSLSRFSVVKMSRIQTELSEKDPFLSTVEGLVEENEQEDLDVKHERKIKYRGAEKGTKRKVRFKRNGRRLEREDLFVHGGELDVNYSVIGSNLSLEQCNDVLKRLEKCSSDGKTLRFFEWMRSNGKLEKNINAYNVVFRVLGRREDWDTAERMIREMRESFGSELDCRVFNTLIYSCSKRGNVELSGKWFSMMLGLGIQPNVATFGMVMGLYQKGWNVEEAEFAFSQMRSFGIICQSAYSAMTTIYTRLSLFNKAEEVIGLMREDKVVLNLENWLVLLNAYSQQGKLQKAEEVLVSMQEAKFSPNIVAYNILITGYGKVSNMFAAQRLFLGIQNAGLEPDETTYRSMIEGWGRVGNYKEAEWYYKELKRLGFKPNSSNLFTLINLQAQHGDKEGACRTLDDMLKVGCQYSSIIGTLLKAYEKVGKIEKIPLLLKGSFYQHVMINQNSCSILVIAYVRNLLVDEAIKVLEDKKWNDPDFEDNLYHLLICSCKELGHLESAVKIYTLMPQSYGRPNLHISCTMIDIYTTMGQFSEGDKLYLKLKTSGIALDVIAFSVVVRMYVKVGSLKDACSVLETMEKERDIVPDIYLFRDMLRIYQQCGMMDKLKDVYCKILNSGVVWDQELYNCLINCCARALPVDELSRLFNEMLQRDFDPNTITFNVMIDVYAKAKLFDKARELFMMARKRGLVDVISYNTIVSAYGHNRDFENMASTIHSMQSDGFSVSLEAYNCTLDAYGKEGQMENFRTVLQKMKKSSCTADHYTYNIIMNIYGEQGWIDEVAGVLIELRERGLRPDLCSYNTLIKAYGIAGMVEDAAGLIKEMKQNGIEPDKITYTLFRDMLHTYQQCGMIDKLKDLCCKILTSRVVWDQELYNCLINCCARALPVDELSRLFNEMLQRGFDPNTITFNVMLDVYAKAKLFNKARELFIMARKRGLVDVISYNTIVSAYGRNRDFKNMASAIHSMQSDGFSVSLEAYNCQLDAYGKEGHMESFRSVLQRIKESGCTADQYTFNIMMNIYGERGWIDEVAGVLTELRECGLRPDLCSYNTLIKAYGIAGMVEDAVGLIKEMRQNGIEPDKITYTNLITALQKNDKYLEAVKWSLWMKQRGL